MKENEKTLDTLNEKKNFLIKEYVNGNNSLKILIWHFIDDNKILIHECQEIYLNDILIYTLGNLILYKNETEDKLKNKDKGYMKNILIISFNDDIYLFNLISNGENLSIKICENEVSVYKYFKLTMNIQKNGQLVFC